MTRKQVLIEAERSKPFTLELGPLVDDGQGGFRQVVYIIEEVK